MEQGKKPIIFLEGKLVYFCPPEKERDINFYMRWINDPETRPFLNQYLPTSREYEENWFARFAERNTERTVLTIVDKEKSVPIGNVGVHEINWKNRTCIVGMVIGEKVYRTKGYGYDASMALLSYLFLTLNLRKIYARVFAFNDASIALQKKCGGVKEGLLIKDHYVNGEYVDTLLFGLFKKQWLTVWKKYKV